MLDIYQFSLKFFKNIPKPSIAIIMWGGIHMKSIFNYINHIVVFLLLIIMSLTIVSCEDDPPKTKKGGLTQYPPAPTMQPFQQPDMWRQSIQSTQGGICTKDTLRNQGSHIEIIPTQNSLQMPAIRVKIQARCTNLERVVLRLQGPATNTQPYCSYAVEDAKRGFEGTGGTCNIQQMGEPQELYHLTITAWLTPPKTEEAPSETQQKNVTDVVEPLDRKSSEENKVFVAIPPPFDQGIQIFNQEILRLECKRRCQQDTQTAIDINAQSFAYDKMFNLPAYVYNNGDTEYFRALQVGNIINNEFICRGLPLWGRDEVTLACGMLVPPVACPDLQRMQAECLQRVGIPQPQPLQPQQQQLPPPQ